ncbi:hypothetical protein [Okeania sp. SIO2C2]|nr:hypothetical protein [Okeania sp. SIO2C2]
MHRVRDEFVRLGGVGSVGSVGEVIEKEEVQKFIPWFSKTEI